MARLPPWWGTGRSIAAAACSACGTYTTTSSECPRAGCAQKGYGEGLNFLRFLRLVG